MFGRGPSFGASALPARPLPTSQLLFSQTRETLLPSFSTACALFSSLLQTRATPIPFPFIRLHTLCAKHPGVTTSAPQNPQALLQARTDHGERATHQVSPLESALTAKCRVLPSFGRTGVFVSPAFPALTDTPFLTPLESALTKNVGRGLVLAVGSPPPTKRYEDVEVYRQQQRHRESRQSAAPDRVARRFSEGWDVQVREPNDHDKLCDSEGVPCVCERLMSATILLAASSL